MTDKEKKYTLLGLVILALTGWYCWDRKRKTTIDKTDTKEDDTETPIDNGSNGNGGAGGGLHPLPQQADVYGTLEQVQPNHISGWALNSNNFSDSVELDIYVDGTKQGTTTANVKRADVSGILANQYGDVGNDKFGFNFNYNMPQGQHTIKVVSKLTGQELTNSPFILISNQYLDVFKDPKKSNTTIIYAP